MGAECPEEFIPLLTEEDAGFIGDWIAGSGSRGVDLLRELILGPDLEKSVMALHALWGFEEAAGSEPGEPRVPLEEGLRETIAYFRAIAGTRGTP